MIMTKLLALVDFTWNGFSMRALEYFFKWVSLRSKTSKTYTEKPIASCPTGCLNIYASLRFHLLKPCCSGVILQMRFAPGETSKEIVIQLVEGAEWRSNYVFYVHLKLISVLAFSHSFVKEKVELLLERCSLEFFLVCVIS